MLDLEWSKDDDTKTQCSGWIELKDKDMHCEEWECMIANFTEEEANTTNLRSAGNAQR